MSIKDERVPGLIEAFLTSFPLTLDVEARGVAGGVGDAIGLSSSNSAFSFFCTFST
jgi:hypothetical protein